MRLGDGVDGGSGEVVVEGMGRLISRFKTIKMLSPFVCINIILSNYDSSG